MKTGIIIQARMSSTRLPGKVMLDLAGHKVLWHVYQRCRRSQLVDEVVVATSIHQTDDAIEKFCAANGIPVFRGSLDDVLARFCECAKEFNFDVVVRVTADCPLIEPAIIDGCIRLFQKGGADYVSNALRRIYPRGLDCEITSFPALEEANVKTNDPYDREHVMPYIVKHMRTAAYEVSPEYRADFRVTLDEPADYELLKRIYSRFYREGEIVDSAEVIKYLIANPEIAAINFNVVQKGGRAIVILGGWVSKGEDGAWYADDLYPGFKEFGPSGHRLRLLAGYYLQKEKPGTVIVASGGKGKHSHDPEAPAVSAVMKKELQDLGVPGESIKEDSKSDNTYQQLAHLPEMVASLAPKEILIISNAYHLPRIRAFMECVPDIKDRVVSMPTRLVAAEDVVSRHDEKLRTAVKRAYASPGMRKQEAIEARGIADLKAGNYKF